jgi:ComF family protein
MKSLLKRSLDILYPRRCPLCGTVLVKGEETVCGNCRKKVCLIQEPFCLKCGKPLNDPREEYCLDCRRHRHWYEEGRAAFPYTGEIRESILKMKQQNQRTYAEFFGEAMSRKFLSCEKRWQIDFAAPIPLHPKKRRYRGFNQAELLLNRVSELTGVPVVKDLLKKTEETVEQKELDRKSRQKNLKKAFKISPYDVQLKRILLVDDIYTTGSTMDAAAAVLKEAGAEKIFFLTACIGTEREVHHSG